MEKKFKKAFPSAHPDLSKKVLSERFKTVLIDGKNKDDSDLDQHLKVRQADELDPKEFLKAAKSLEKILGKQSSVNNLATPAQEIEDRITERVIKSLSEIDMKPDDGLQSVRDDMKQPDRGRRNRFSRSNGRRRDPRQSFSRQSQSTTCFICHQPGLSEKPAHTETAVVDVRTKDILHEIVQHSPPSGWRQSTNVKCIPSQLQRTNHGQHIFGW